MILLYKLLRNLELISNSELDYRLRLYSYKKVLKTAKQYRYRKRTGFCFIVENCMITYKHFCFHSLGEMTELIKEFRQQYPEEYLDHNRIAGNPWWFEDDKNLEKRIKLVKDVIKKLENG